MAINIPKPRKYETEKEYILKWCNNASIIQKIPDKQKRINAVRQAFKNNFNPRQ